MAIKAIFVGINKHLDTSIPELGGARRDATALWALFTDTSEGMETTRCRDLQSKLAVLAIDTVSCSK
ncbi:hypothetical protein [Ralstonia pseudosolanacearum]|uniref:hypothetical protein n=1 Tax=Ralstonia pseudosolanacearum TaxID=1310165 RepID=UPI0018D0D024|nr:hypothetical protein [Ralstonia pseudosolanacearum]